MSGVQDVEPGRLSWSARVVFTALAVVAFILGMVGFQQYLPAHPEYGRGTLDLVYYSLQLFVLDAAPLQTATDLPLALQIARFAAPAVTAYLIILALQALLLQRLVQARIGLMRGHSILCGPDDLTRQLAGQIGHETGGKVVVVGGRGRAALRQGPLHVPGDPRQRAILDRAGLSRAREVIAVGPDSVRNAEVAIAVHAANRADKTAVICYAEARDGQLFQAVVGQEVRPGVVNRLDLFGRHDRTARALLDHLAPFPPSDPRSAVLVIGYAGLGQVLIDRLVQFWSGDTSSSGAIPCLCVLDADVPADVVTRRHADPGGRVAVSARRSDPSWLTTVDDLLVPTADGAQRVPGRIYVCLPDDAAGIALGDAALRLLTEHETTIVVAVPDSGVLGDAAGTEANRAVRVLGKARLVLVSVMRTVYSMAAIRTGTNEQLAMAIHATYLKHAEERGDTAATNDSVRPWDELPEYLKDSNREQAWDIGHKLAMVGLSAVPQPSSGRPVTLSAADVEKLAKAEHRRWMNERTAKGWRHGQTRDNDRKLHPDLVEWEYLSEDSRDKDREAVRAIPAHLAAAGLAIVRTTG